MEISSIRREAKVRLHQRWYSHAIPSGNRVPVTLATFTLVGHRLRSAREDRWCPTTVCRPSPPLLNHPHPEDLGSARVRYAWRHRLLRPPLPVSVPPFDFSLRGYTNGLCHTGLSWLGPRPSLFRALVCATMPSSFDPRDADRC